MKRKHVTLLPMIMATLFALCFVFSSCGGKNREELSSAAKEWISNAGYVRVDKDRAVSDDGEYILLGEYPQTEVDKKELVEVNREWVPLVDVLSESVSPLPTEKECQGWTDYKYYINNSPKSYMWYIDTQYEGERFRGVYFQEYRPYWTGGSSAIFDTYQNENGYKKNHVYWFRYEPIEWRILCEDKEKKEVLLLCEMLIDSQEFHYTTSAKTIDGEKIYSNNYAESTIRMWLNESFYHTAFNDMQKQRIIKTTVDNSAMSTKSGNNPYESKNTEDNVFLLSWQDAINKEYGFDEGYAVYDKTRQKEATDYAKCQGGAVMKAGSYAKNGYWWLRSPSTNFEYNACYVGCDGYSYIDYSVEYTNGGVCPALNIRLA